MKKIISIDIDEVLRNFVQSLQRVYQEKYPKDWIKPVTGYKLAPFFEKGNEINEFFSIRHACQIFDNATMIDAETNLTQQLHDLGHYIILNSNQPNELCGKLALNWIIDKNIYYDAFVLTSDKSIVNCDIHLDDATHHLEVLKQKGIRAVAFDRPWNQDWTGERVKTHQEFIDLIQRG
jgi:5'(3')-deoxyribonucleotidase